MSRERHTRIMATVPDNRCSADFITLLCEAGMDSVRINSAHVDASTFSQMVRTIRDAAPQVAILMDTKGPEIRTTPLASEFVGDDGEELSLCEGKEMCSRERLYVPVDGLISRLSPGTRVLFDDGEVQFEVTCVEGGEARLRALNSGNIGSRKTIAFPGVALPPLPPVSERDRVMIQAACESRIDMIAHSFVRSAADVRAVKDLIEGSGIKLYAKIECREALDNLEEIAAEADGLLVARGDLGAQIPLPMVPAAQLKSAVVAHQFGKSTMLATQILQSMMKRPLPSRAELSDIFLAVAEGIDCLLLTGETAQGDYPAECVRILNETIIQAEALKCKISMNI